MSRYGLLFRSYTVPRTIANAIIREKDHGGHHRDASCRTGHRTAKLPTPAGAYVPYTISGKILFISGQIPMRNGALSHTGKVGSDLSVEDGYECARASAP